MAGITVTSRGPAFDRGENPIGKPPGTVVSVSPSSGTGGAIIPARGSGNNNAAALRDFVSVMDYGADRSGTVACTTALRNAIAEAQALAGAGFGANHATTVYVPNGRYLLDGKIQIPDGVTLRGEGIWQTHFYYGANFPDNAVFEPTKIDWSQQIANLEGFALFGPQSGGAPTSNQPNGGGATTVQTTVAANAVQTSFTLVAAGDITSYASNGTLNVGAQRVRYQSKTLGTVGTQTFNNCYITSGWGTAINSGDAISPVTTNNVVGISWIGLGGPCLVSRVWSQYNSDNCLLNIACLNTSFEHSNFTNAGRDTILHEGSRTNSLYHNVLAQYANAGDGAGTFACLHIRGQSGTLSFQGFHKVENLYMEVSAHNAIGLWLQNHGAISADTVLLEGGTNLGGTSYATQTCVQIDSSQSSPLTQDGTHAANIMLRNIGVSQIGRTLLKDNLRGYSTPASATTQGTSMSDYRTDDYATPIVAKTYGATVTPNASQWNTVTATNGTAFTIAAPFSANPPTDRNQEMTVEILNSSGGALGAITFNAIYKMALGAFTAPANGLHRFVTFRWNGANWVAINMATADY